MQWNEKTLKTHNKEFSCMQSNGTSFIRKMLVHLKRNSTQFIHTKVLYTDIEWNHVNRICVYDSVFGICIYVIWCAYGRYIPQSIVATPKNRNANKEMIQNNSFADSVLPDLSQFGIFTEKSTEPYGQYECKMPFCVWFALVWAVLAIWHVDAVTNWFL